LVVLGSDYFHTLPSTTFDGVNFKGVPINPSQLGGTDTIVQRNQDAAVAPALGVAGTAPPINITLQTLQLESTAPTNAFGPLDNYFITLQTARTVAQGGPGPASTGQMTISMNSTDTGGTFSSFFDVFFDIHQGSLTGNIVGSGDLVLSNSGASWSTTPIPGSVIVKGTDEDPIPDAQDQAANLHTNLTATEFDFFPGMVTEMHPNGARHIVSPVPEPSYFVLLSGLIGGIGLLAKKRRRISAELPVRD